MYLKSLWMVTGSYRILPTLSHLREKKTKGKKKTPIVLEKFGADILRVSIFLTKNSTSPKKACAFLKTWVPANAKALFPFPWSRQGVTTQPQHPGSRQGAGQSGSPRGQRAAVGASCRLPDWEHPNSLLPCSSLQPWERGRARVGLLWARWDRKSEWDKENCSLIDTTSAGSNTLCILCTYVQTVPPYLCSSVGNTVSRSSQDEMLSAKYFFTPLITTISRFT